MSVCRSGGVCTMGSSIPFVHRARLFPLPFLAPAAMPPTLTSARVRLRVIINKQLINHTNDAIQTLNKLYKPYNNDASTYSNSTSQSHSSVPCNYNSIPPQSSGHDHLNFSSSSFVPSFPPSFSSSCESQTAHFNAKSPLSCVIPSDDSTKSSSDSIARRLRVISLPPSTSPPSLTQLRILLSLRRRCKIFIQHARAEHMCYDKSYHSHADCDSSMGKVDDHSCMMSHQQVVKDRNSTTKVKHIDTDIHHGDYVNSVSMSHLPLSLSLSNSSSCFSSSPTAVVPLIASRVSLPTLLRIVPLASVLPIQQKQIYCTPPITQAKETIDNDTTNINPLVSSHPLLRSPFDVSTLNSLSPLKPARIAGSRSEYVRLIARMHSEGMLAFTDSPKAVNGIFAVRKDETHDRIIIDAQPANRLFVDPAHVQLPSPSHLIQLSLKRGEKMYVGKSDLSNFYHHLGLPDWMQPYFALPKLTHSELKSIGLASSSSSLLLYPMCVTVPMGFSHGVSLAQSAHLQVLYRLPSVLRDDSNMPSPSSPYDHHPPLHSQDNILHTHDMTVTRTSALHGVIIDDFFIFSRSRSVATGQMKRVLAAYESAGFVVKDSKVVWPTSKPVKVIGFMVHGKKATIDLQMETIQSLIHATQSVIHACTITSTHLSHLIGRWTWLLMIRRPALAVLQQVYRFIIAAKGKRFAVWPSVRRELSMLLTLLPLLHARLDAPFFRRVVASDASEHAAGVVTTNLTTQMEIELKQICSAKQSAHLQMLLNCPAARNSVALHTSTPTEPVDLFDSDFISSSASASDLPISTLSVPSLSTPKPRTLKSITAVITAQRSFDSLYARLSCYPWRVLISHVWRSNSEHINLLEFRSALLSCHWLLSNRYALSSRAFLLVDSATVFYSCWKGRTSSPRLLLLMRKLSALVLSADITLMTGWIPSAINPADEPSRRKDTSDTYTGEHLV